VIRWVELPRPACAGSPWLQWVRRHGIDPDEVMLDSIECDDERRTVTYMHRSRTRGGRGPFGQWRVMQLEAPALPFPGNGEFPTGVAVEGRQHDP
jgi:hypothetical protein